MSNTAIPLTCETQAKICEVKFQAIVDKLEVMHGDMGKLHARITNGMSQRIVEVEAAVKIIMLEQDRKTKRVARWETAIISAVVVAATGLALFIGRLYVEHDQAHPAPVAKQKVTP